jgi:hypothetical protein
MRTTLYIHIGVYKTGSKSIQYTLFNNREKLLEHGINYLSIEPNHSPMFFSLFSPAPHQDIRNIHRRMDTPEKAAVYNEAIKRKLRDELSKNTSPKMVISAEGLSTVHNGAEQLKALLDPFASAYRIVVYVRNPYDFASSATLQRVKAGELLGGADEKSVIPNYKSWLAKYVNTFGRENVDIRIFDPKLFVGGDLVPDFLTAIGESPELTKEIKVERANEALSHEAGLILHEMNQVVPPRINGHANDARVPRMDKYLEKVVGEKFAINPAVYEGQEAVIAESLDWLQEMLGKPVFEQLKPRPASVPRWSEDTVNSIKRTVGEMAEKIRTIKARQKKLRWLGVGNGDPGADITIPAGLEWLSEAVNPQTRGHVNSQSWPAPHFDQASIRTLACFIHDLAFTIRKLTRRKPVNDIQWVIERYNIKE